MNENKSKIKVFFARFFRVDELKDSDDIFAMGLVNSLFAMQLVAWLEKNFFPVTDEDLDINNFNSIQAIASLIERKQLASVTA